MVTRNPLASWWGAGNTHEFATFVGQRDTARAMWLVTCKIDLHQQSWVWRSASSGGGLSVFSALRVSLCDGEDSACLVGLLGGEIDVDVTPASMGGQVYHHCTAVCDPICMHLLWWGALMT